MKLKTAARLETVFGIMTFVLFFPFGLYDKNGKEIYEGDIVKHPWIDPIFRDLVESEEGAGVTSEVVFHDGAFVVKYDVNDYIYLDGFTRHGHVEVIGNIYDNPNII